jgi:hypothetical protein
LRHEDHEWAEPGSAWSNPAYADRSKPRLARQSVPIRSSPCALSCGKCSDGVPAEDPEPFNAHSPGGRGSGLAQHVFRSPARIPAAESSWRSPCAAPPSEKRCTLCVPNGGLKMAFVVVTLLSARCPSHTGGCSVVACELARMFYTLMHVQTYACLQVYQSAPVPRKPDRR